MPSEGGSDGLYHCRAARRRRQALRRRQRYPKQRGTYKQDKARTEHPPQRKHNPPRWCEKYLPTFASDSKKELLCNAMVFPPRASRWNRNPMGRGYIYIYRLGFILCHSSTWDLRMLKIGRTNNIPQRMEQHAVDCNQNVKELVFYPHDGSSCRGGVLYYGWVEWLVHLELEEQRRYRPCEGVHSYSHGEWFSTCTLWQTKRVVKRWVEWAQEYERRSRNGTLQGGGSRLRFW